MTKLQTMLRCIGIGVLAGLGNGCGPEPVAAPAALPELAGRSAGQPQSCVGIGPATTMRIADRRTILYGSGATIWVNRLGSECFANSIDILVMRPTGPQYCRGDIVSSVSPQGGIPGPSCVLGDFVPYRR